jgi:hypothetical protein
MYGAPQPPPRNHSWVWPVATVVVVAIIAVVVGVIFVTRHNSGSNQPVAATATPSTSATSSTASSSPSVAVRHHRKHVYRHRVRVRTQTRTVVVNPPAPNPPPQQAGPVAVSPQPYLLGANAYFVTPSRNIDCAIYNDSSPSATCTIASYLWDEPGPDCNNGAVVQVTAYGSPQFLSCAASEFQPNSVELSYGYSLTNGQFTCTSASTGVTCTDNDTGDGFTLSRESFQQF